MRFIAGLLGSLCLAMPILMLVEGKDNVVLADWAKFLAVIAFGVIILAYAIGGQSLLRKVAPHWADKDWKGKPLRKDKNSNQSTQYSEKE